MIDPHAQHTYSGGTAQCSHCGNWTRGANNPTECPARLRAALDAAEAERDRLLALLRRCAPLVNDEKWRAQESDGTTVQVGQRRDKAEALLNDVQAALATEETGHE